MSKVGRDWLSACAILCNECTIHLRAHEELSYWRAQSVDPDTIRCNGCRSSRDAQHWSADCGILKCCVDQKKLSYCSECPEFPCQTLMDWGKSYDHHAKALARLREMKALGTEAWLKAHGYE